MAETFLLASAVKAGTFAYKKMFTHCKHCTGEGACSCECGCPTNARNKCFAFFKGRSCASCRSQGIKGSLFQCRTCPRLTLCSTCYYGGAHKSHAFIEFERVGAEPKFLPAQTDGPLPPATITHMPSAGTLSQRPPSYATQQSLPVCLPTQRPTATVVPAHLSQSTPNLAPAQPQPHGPYVRHNSMPATVLPNTSSHPTNNNSNRRKVVVGCDLCSREGSRTSHLKCAVCKDFDLCEACHGTAFHGHHSFYQYKEDATEPLVHPPMDGRGAIHPRVCCDWCTAEDIRGARYKCAECPEFDLCQVCYGNSAHSHHAFLRFDHPGIIPVRVEAKQTLLQKQTQTSQNFANGNGNHMRPEENADQVHFGVVCDGCGCENIVGYRYKCSQCASHDLCRDCWNAAKHAHHGFLRYDRAGAYPVFVEAKAPADLSSSSSSSWSPTPSRPTVAVLHRNVQCDCCGAEHIQGARYCCQECRGFDCCERCYHRQRHPWHGMIRYDFPGAAPLFLGSQKASSVPIGGRQEDCDENGFMDQLATDLMENAIEDMAEQLGETILDSFGGGGQEEEHPSQNILGALVGESGEDYPLESFVGDDFEGFDC